MCLSSKGNPMSENAAIEVGDAPDLTVPLMDEVARNAVTRLIDALEDHDDVKDVYSNAEFPA